MLILFATLCFSSIEGIAPASNVVTISIEGLDIAHNFLHLDHHFWVHSPLGLTFVGNN